MGPRQANMAPPAARLRPSASNATITPCRSNDSQHPEPARARPRRAPGNACCRAAAYLEATRLAGFSTEEAGKFFGRAPKFSAVIERDYLTPWPAELAETRYLERFERLVRE